ncbi:MAG: signal peptidase I [Candidatus Izimaplasma sp.]|nr:signal peptidase I [Candidatus Izimaplasma bacterium]
MLDEIKDVEGNNEEITEDDKVEIVEKIDYTVLTKIYRKKLMKRISIVFVSVVLIFMSRFFKYAAFDILIASPSFKFLLGLSIAMGFGILIYINASKNKIKTEQESKILKSFHSVFDLVSVVPLFMAVMSLINILAISPATVVGQSMEPTFYEGQDILMLHITNNYKRFDIIVLETDSGEFYLKRIIGLPGETVKIDHNIITINGIEIVQEFLKNEFGSIDVFTYCNSSYSQVCEFNVPDDSYFVLGDNREHSLDSRSDLLGYVHEEQLYGVVVLKFNNILRGVLDQE